jgi:glutathione S-transferase
MKLFGSSVSGNSYKARLLLAHLGIPYTWQEVDVRSGGTRTPEFLAKNPNHKVPLLEIEPGRYLAESGAILFYLADGTPFWPADHYARAQVLQWMFFEQFSHAPNLAAARFIRRFLPADHARRAELPQLLERGDEALGIMEQHLAARAFFVDERYTIADIALFAYTHVAAEGGFDLARFPALQAWLGRVRQQPGFIPLG